MPVRRILVADDDPPLRGLLRLVASRAGFEVDTASNGADALEKIRNNTYAVAIIDLMMPQLSGYELIDHLAEIKSRPAVVVVTAMNETVLPRLNSSVVSSILRKPFDIQMLTAVMQELASSSEEKRHTRDSKVVDFPQKA